MPPTFGDPPPETSDSQVTPRTPQPLPRIPVWPAVLAGAGAALAGASGFLPYSPTFTPIVLDVNAQGGLLWILAGILFNVVPPAAALVAAAMVLFGMRSRVLTGVILGAGIATLANTLGALLGNAAFAVDTRQGLILGLAGSALLLVGGLLAVMRQSRAAVPERNFDTQIRGAWGDATGQPAIPSPLPTLVPGAIALNAIGNSSGVTPPPGQQQPGPAPGIAYAGFWIRVGAYLLDAIPLFIVALVLFIPIFASIGRAISEVPFPPAGVSVYSPEYQAWQQALAVRMTQAFSGMYPLIGLLQLVSVAYFVGFWTWRGQTPGMMLLGLRIARDQDGAKPGLGRSILRYVGYILSWVTLFIGFIWVAFDSRKQGWPDKLAGTVVVRRSG